MSLTLLFILIFLGLALLFYTLFGGADFGAGILEVFLGKSRRQDQQKLISHAMAPVWEANHVWLVLVIVILFMGFPIIYTSMSIYLHIPLIAILVGIVGRGCAFTFRYYDPVRSSYYKVYSHIFAFSSLWTSFFLGVTAGAITLGKIDPQAKTYSDLYLSPWMNLFCVSTGFFTICLFAFLAAVYLTGETKDKDLHKIFRRKAAIVNVLMVIAGILVFLSAEWNHLFLLKEFFKTPTSIASFALATFLLFFFWKNILKPKQTIWVRILGAAIVSLVLLGWYAVQYPAAFGTITFQQASAPEVTLRVLLGSLLVGAALIFPALGYLLKIFKWETFEPF